MWLKIKVMIAALMLCGALVGCGPSAEKKWNTQYTQGMEKVNQAMMKWDAAKQTMDWDARKSSFAAAKQAINELENEANEKCPHAKEGVDGWEKCFGTINAVDNKLEKDWSKQYPDAAEQAHEEDVAYAAGRDAMDKAALDCYKSKGDTDRECHRVWSAAYDALTEKFPNAFKRESRRDAGRISARESVEDTKARVGFLTGCRDGYTTDSAGTMHCNSKPVDVRIVP